MTTAINKAPGNTVVDHNQRQDANQQILKSRLNLTINTSDA